MQHKTPSEKVLANPYDGKEITDSMGRKLKLKNPDILDMYDLMSALGEDSANQACLQMAMKTLFIGAIDNSPVQSPKSYAEVRASIKRIGTEGFSALAKFIDDAEKQLQENQNPNEKAFDRVKK